MPQLPDWADGLRGADRVVVDRRPNGVDYRCEPESGEPRFRRTISLPTDLEAWAEEIDPLIPAHVVAEVITALQGKLHELVLLARREGHSWAEIGQALGVSKQAAWQAHGRS